MFLECTVFPALGEFLSFLSLGCYCSDCSVALALSLLRDSNGFILVAQHVLRDSVLGFVTGFASICWRGCTLCESSKCSIVIRCMISVFYPNSVVLCHSSCA
jgi:hypothetical protein